MKTNRHNSSGARRRIAATLVLAAAIAAGALAGRTTLPPQDSTAAITGQVASQASSSYGWPVKPFDQQHPVRGSFGDPRTVFTRHPTLRNLLTSGGAFSYHQGIDISAPDGTPIYAVRSGVVRIVTRDWIEVDSDGGVAFQYWHINSAVHVGDHVQAQTDVLGHIMRASKHVHLTELSDGKAVNPLSPGHLGPYADTTTPRIGEISFRAGDTGPELLPEYLHGRVEMVVSATDTHAIPVPGQWAGLPITPAKLTFRIDGFPNCKVVRPETIAFDVRRGLPSSNMWHTYARGSHMNMVQMGVHRYWYNPGVYLFKLTETPFDTRTLPDGVYRLVATAWDTAGNHGSAAQIFQVHNRASWLKG